MKAVMKEKKGNDFVISFRVNEKERNDLLVRANESGVSISQLMRIKLDLLNNKMLRS